MAERKRCHHALANSLMVGGVALAAALLIAELGHAAPDAVSVGDIIAFEPAPGPIGTGAVLPSGRIAVHRPNQFGCILDLNTLRRYGGSLVTEARLASEGESYRMHWAGERTAPNSGDCGPNADLIVERSDLQPAGRRGRRLYRGHPADRAGEILGRSAGLLTAGQSSSPTAFTFKSRSRSWPPWVCGSISSTFCQAR